MKNKCIKCQQIRKASGVSYLKCCECRQKQGDCHERCSHEEEGDKIGKDKIEHLKYNRKKIKEAMVLTDYHKKATGTEVLKLIANSFEAGQWYSAKYIKEELTRIFNLVGLQPKEAVTSHTINKFFHAVQSQRKKAKGYQLIK